MKQHTLRGFKYVFIQEKHVILQLILNIIIFVFVYNMLQVYVSVFNVTRHVVYDLPCDDVSLSVSEDLKMLENVVNVTRRKGINFCSLKNLSYIVDKVAERNATLWISYGLTKKSLRCGNENAAKPMRDSLAFFSTLKTQSNTSNAGRAEDTVLQWRNDTRSSHVGENFSYDLGRIRVHSNDYFYVYVSLTFQQGTCVVKEEQKEGIRGRLMTIFVAIYKQSRSYPNMAEILVYNNVEPVCTRNDDVTTVHIGSHIFLNRDDEVFVKVMDTHRLVNSEGNTFGLFVIK